MTATLRKKGLKFIFDGKIAMCALGIAAGYSLCIATLNVHIEEIEKAILFKCLIGVAIHAVISLIILIKKLKIRKL